MVLKMFESYEASEAIKMNGKVKITSHNGIRIITYERDLTKDQGHVGSKGDNHISSDYWVC